MNIHDCIHDLEQIVHCGDKVEFKRACVEAKVLVDRWNLVTTSFYVSYDTFKRLSTDKLWGADIHPSNLVKDNEVIALTDMETSKEKRISKAIVNSWVSTRKLL